MALCVEREADGEGWLVRTHDREHGWVCGDFTTAISEANVIASALDVVVCSSAGGALR
jgi:hypothetical protein